MLKRLRKARTRLYLAELARAGAWTLAVLALAGSVLTFASRLDLFRLPPVLAWVVAVLACTVAAFVAWRKTPDLPGTARAVERHFGLDERLSTSLELGGRRDALAEALRADAERHAEGLVFARFGVPRLGRPEGWVLVAAAVATLLAMFVPLRPPSAPALAAGQNAGAPGAAPAAAQREFVRQAVAQVQAAAPASSAAQDVRTNKGPGTARQASEGSSQVNASATMAGASAGPVSATTPTTVERVLDEVSAAVSGAPASANRAAPAAPLADDAPLSVRNDGSTNPSYNQPSARDQELRDYGRRRELASNPGGGSGDPVAMVDAAVAGDATAGFEGAAGNTLPAAPGASSELNIPSVTDSSGRRVRLERLPDDIDTTGLGAAPTWVEFVAAPEPIVSREAAASPADLEFLSRYRSPTEGASE